MRVICINDNWSFHPEAKGMPRPVFMEECYVTRSCWKYGHNCFYTLGGRFSKITVFHARHFAIISDLDEVEIYKERCNKSERF